MTRHADEQKPQLPRGRHGGGQRKRSTSMAMPYLSSISNRCLACIVALALLIECGLATSAHGQVTDLWGEVVVPGGIVAARRVAGLGDIARPGDTGLLLDFIRRHAATGVDRPADELARYTRSVNSLLAVLGTWPDGFGLPTGATQPQERQRVERLLQTLGLDLRRRGRQYEVTEDGSQDGAERRAWAQALGADPGRLMTDLNIGLTVKVPLVETSLPLPLPDFWRAEVFERNTMPVLTILRDRSALLTYHGLMAIDTETLLFLAARPELTRRIRNDVSPRFATFARSLRVRNDVVQVPGGEDAVPVWTALVGRRPQDAERFLLDVLGRDDGRLAYFYDTIAQLDHGRRQFVMGAHLAGRERADFVRRVYDRFGSVGPEWKVDVRPFDRPGFDAAQALLTVDVYHGGIVGSSWWPTVLERVATSTDWPSAARDVTRNLRDRPADARWMLEWIFESPSDAQRRFRLLRYAQRHLRAVDREAAYEFEIALRAFADMPSLALMLERTGVSEPSTLRDLALAARAITQSGGADDVLPRLARWQAGLGLLEQIHRRAPLPAATLQRLLQSLVGLSQLRSDTAAGSTASWIHDHLLPSLPMSPDESVALEHRFVRAATIPAVTRERPVNWEGLTYVAAPGAAAARDALAIRQLRTGPRLDDVMALHRLRLLVEAGPKTLEDVRVALRAFEALEPVVVALPAVQGRPPAIVDDFHDAIVNIRRITRANDIRRVARQLPILLEAIDAVTDAVVLPLLYALALTPTSQPAVYRETWLAHSIRPTSGPTDMSAVQPWREVAWQMPVTADGVRGGVRLVGAYLLLDVGLAEARLVRLPSLEPPVPSAMSLEDRTPVVQALALAHTGDFTSTPAAEAGRAVIRGRERVTGWQTRAPAGEALTSALVEAGVDAWRVNQMTWSVAAGMPEALDGLSLAELHRLGGGQELPVGWSSGAMAVDGCVCYAAPRRVGPEDLRGRRLGLQALGAQDLPLRLADHLVAMNLDASLVPLLLPAATQDWLDRAAPSFPDDWEAAAVWPRTVSRDRVEEYLLNLVATGVLGPAGAMAGGTR